MSDAPLLDPADVVISPDTDADELVRQLRDADRERKHDETGIVWFLQHNHGKYERCLTVGVRGDVGALMWFTDVDAFLPAHGTNVDDVEYFFTGGHLFVMEPGTELPIEHVHEAAREYVRTGQRPRSVTWTRPHQ